MRGKPLERRRRNFSLSADRYALSLAGPPAHSRRLREIQEEIGAHEERLAEAWVELVAQHGGDTQRLACEWRSLAERWRFDAVNELIERHNLFYPAEARLAMDPRTRDFVPVGGRPYRMRPLDSGWILQRFPPERPGVVG